MTPSDGSSVTFRRPPATLRQRMITKFARVLERDVAKGRAFNMLLTGDADLRRLNSSFRGQDYATDVLSFPSEGGGVFLGDIAISLGRARAQARQFGHSIEHEVQILMLHGVLHLLGYDHETDTGAMARAEKRWRAKLGLPSSLIDRVRA
jgi:probable rRNA maturation factor